MTDAPRPDTSPLRILRTVPLLWALLVLIVGGLALLTVFFSDAPALSPPPEPAPESSSDSDLVPGPDDLHVLVSKSQRRLFLYRGDTQLRSFPIVLGSQPTLDKQREGDGRTPVGAFYVCEKNAKSRYYLFIGISYPNREDADRGLRDNLITPADHETILRALAQRKSPPWYTRLGGEIGLHGGGTAWDWTEGCIALDNADIRDLYASIRVGAIVTIEP